MIDDQFYVKLGRMTVAFGELDIMVGWAVANLAERLGEEPDRVPIFTAQRLGVLKDWTKKHAAAFEDNLAGDLRAFANDATALLRRRQDAVHGLWIQEGDASTAWALMLARGSTGGEPSTMDAVEVDRLTDEAGALNQRVSELFARFVRAHG